jgi:CspA family cold shock protein
MLYGMAKAEDQPHVAATVREWRPEEGWGVLDSAETPGGCWAHFSAVDMTGYRELHPGQNVRLHWEKVEQDGYRFRAVQVLP